ncbi:hypothetical protein V6N13_072754 [Hibiscus sabdariffa]|uniref:Uncharacterized protein n=1 Tax=Hibiscus sabdariffa TaxID=183260 RepID=A0ABR2E8J8_9ROSI
MSSSRGSNQSQLVSGITRTQIAGNLGETTFDRRSNQATQGRLTKADSMHLRKITGWISLLVAVVFAKL